MNKEDIQIIIIDSFVFSSTTHSAKGELMALLRLCYLHIYQLLFKLRFISSICSSLSRSCNVNNVMISCSFSISFCLSVDTDTNSFSITKRKEQVRSKYLFHQLTFFLFCQIFNLFFFYLFHF